MTSQTSAPLRPRDLALLLLASGNVLPRQRARDQQADRAGLELKRRLLDWVAALDPDPAQLEVALTHIVEEFGPPSGPTRALAVTFLEEFRSARDAPDWIGQLLHEAMRHSEEEQRGGGRQQS